MTSAEDIEALPGIVTRLGGAVDAELRPAELHAKAPRMLTRMREAYDERGDTVHAISLGLARTGTEIPQEHLQPDTRPQTMSIRDADGQAPRRGSPSPRAEPSCAVLPRLASAAGTILC